MDKNINNSTEDIKIRRTKDILISSGTGVIMFAVWSVVRTLLNFTLLRKNNDDIFSEISAETGMRPDGGVILGASIAIVLAVLAVEVGLRIYVGLSARAEGKGKNKGNAYLVIAFIMIPIYISGIIMSIVNVATAKGSVVDMTVTVIVEITSLFAYIELALSAVKLKKMKRQQRELNGGKAA